MRGGQLEIFPNTKPYGETVITDYNAHRLPLQSGSFLLDDDFQPISNSVATLLNWADQTASAQDMETLTAALAHTPKTYQPRQPHRPQSDDNQQFQQDVVEILRQGWTGYGQTNDMLIAIAKHGIIFLGLWGQDLTTYIRDTAISTPGYRQWSRHQHEIDKRSQEVARSAERYYTRLHSGKPPRTKTYKQNFYGREERTTNVIPFLPQQQLHEQTLERITATVAMLKAEGQFPSGAYLRTKAISSKSLEMFGLGVSPTTLYKEEYKPLWHPAHEQSPRVEGVNPDATVEKYQNIPDPWPKEIEPPNPVLAGDFQGLHHLPPNEGIYTLPLALPPAVDESAAFEPEFRTLSQECNFQNHSQEVNSTDSTILQIHSHSDTISSVFNSCDDRVSDGFSPTILNDKNFQYPPVAEARAEKSEIPDKEDLSIAEIDLASKPEDRNQNSLLPPALCLLPSSEPLSAHPTFPQRPVDGNFASNPEITQPLSTPPSTLPSTLPPGSLPSSATPGVAFSPEDSPSVVSFLLFSETTVVLDTTASNPIYTPEQHRKAIRLRLQALPQAKRWVRLFSNIEGISLLPKERQQLEKFLQYHLMLASPSTILQQEAAAWFAAHGDIIAGVRDFEVFWQYCQQLL
ncbi:hypothetical protein [Calothrix sp. 336/3]|uniref:hypothetical protein n=1 Tax=Calothrix sp. 336/3 TaxID=1337936 RepID=UPI0011874B2F|nr:hypothetical protein [Calothrix sp. 336/3]